MSDVRPQPEETAAPTGKPDVTGRRRRPAWVLGVGGLALGLVVGGCSGLGVGAVGGAALVADGSSLGDLLTGGGDGDVVGEGERSVAEALPDELPRLRAFVAEERGLAWEREVPVEALDDDAFAVALDGDDAGDATGGEADAVEEEWPVGLDDPDGGRAETYAALGLTPSAAAYREAWDDGDSAVTGFYDTETREVVLRGQTWTPAVEETLVHELTHALDDQHVDLDAVVGEGATPEEVTAGTAVVEGSAEAVAWAWYDSLDDEQLEAYERAWDPEAEAEPGADPDARAAADEGTAEEDTASDPLLDALALFPYDYGYVAVDAVDADGGADAVDDLLQDPLTTTEQVLAARADPGAVPGLAPAVEVGAPVAPDGAEVLGSGSLGLFPLALLPQVADAAGQGYYLEPEDVVTRAWTGDAWTTWVDPADDDRACTAVLVRLEDERGRDDLADALDPWVADASGTGAATEPVGETDLRLTGCGER